MGKWGEIFTFCLLPPAPCLLINLQEFTVMRQLYLNEMGENVNLLVLISQLENEV
jgi:hypothetical protein